MVSPKLPDHIHLCEMRKGIVSLRFCIRSPPPFPLVIRTTLDLWDDTSHAVESTSGKLDFARRYCGMTATRYNFTRELPGPFGWRICQPLGTYQYGPQKLKARRLYISCPSLLVATYAPLLLPDIVNYELLQFEFEHSRGGQAIIGTIEVEILRYKRCDAHGFASSG